MFQSVFCGWVERGDFYVNQKSPYIVLKIGLSWAESFRNYNIFASFTGRFLTLTYTCQNSVVFTVPPCLKLTIEVSKLYKL